MWDDAVFAARTSDAKHPRLDDHAAGEALQLLRHMMESGKKQSVVTKGKLSLSPEVTTVKGSTVEITDCADTTNWLQYKPDGSLKNQRPGGHRRIDATAVERKGAWQVKKFYVHEVGTCG
ncbi:hypothetical protein ACFQVC_21600 [Streptomyces monticola]|uniref:Secreted protein/lipoprotein n=1 Tax=Streptomyces monticola TaxID=2666263 RepID=A0ABW2JL17_9ACTN